MTQWFRFYETALDDPKVQTLPADDFKAWVNILCVACRNDGVLPNVSSLAFMLRMTADGCRTLLERLSNAGLIDTRSGGPNGSHYAPHGWDKRQYKSDTSTDRVKRYRDRSATVTETPPDTETEADTDTERGSEAKASGASAPATVVPIDAKTALFREGLPLLAEITGRQVSGLRGEVAKWAQLSGNDHAAILRLIQRAQAERVIDPMAWINRALKPKDPDEAIYRGVI